MKNNKKIGSIDNDYNGEDEPPKLKFGDVMLDGTNPTTQSIDTNKKTHESILANDIKHLKQFKR